MILGVTKGVKLKLIASLHLVIEIRNKRKNGLVGVVKPLGREKVISRGDRRQKCSNGDVGLLTLSLKGLQFGTFGQALFL